MLYAIWEMLSMGKVQIFFFDNDVYLKRSPMPSPSMMNDSIQLYAQDNGPSGGVKYNQLNFGCFFICSTNQNTLQFHRSLIDFERSPY